MGLKIGWSEVSITPEEKISLLGQFYERISEYVETEITATAMAIDADGAHMVICSCDLEGVGDNLVTAVRERLAGFDTLDPDCVILHATHSHTSIDYGKKRNLSLGAPLDVLTRFFPSAPREESRVVGAEDGVLRGERALAWLADRIAHCVKLAWEDRKPALYANAFGRAAVGMNRRVCYSDGSAKMWGDTNTATFTELEGGNDSGVELLYTFDASKHLTGVVVNIACPSQVVEQRSFISSDYWGKVKILLREKFGEELFVLGLCSPAGDQCPRDLIRWVDPETPIKDPNVPKRRYSRKADPSMYDIKGTWTIGRRIAREIADVYEDLPEDEIRADALFCHKRIVLELPIRRVTPKEYAEATDTLRAFAREADRLGFAEKAAMHVYAGVVARYEAQETHNMYPVEIHIARLGEVAFATNPFELFLNYGNQIRARSHAKQTLLLQLSCGEDGYLPTEKAERGGHYSAYVASGVVGHEGGDLLVRKTLDEIHGMFCDG